MPFSRLIGNAKRVREMLPQLVISQLESRAADITRINRQNLRAGKLSTGANVSPSYSPDYARLKSRTVPDLFGKGVFHSDIFAIPSPSGKELLVGADTTIGSFPLAEFLETKYTSNIYSITDTQLSKIVESEMNNLIKIILDELRS